jgi:zinc transport system ATP-binding protein
MTIIHFQQVSYAVKASPPILTDIDLKIARGQITTIIGPNGAGKTTLLKLMLGLQSPTSGVIHRSTGLTIGYLPQQFKLNPLLPLTVERFLQLSSSDNPKRAASKIDHLLHEVGSCALLHRRMSRLSGGEIQRILLARALMQTPDVLVLDEPAQGVDVMGQADLYALIARLRDQMGCGIVLVSHDLHLVMAASDQVICLNHHVCCSGSPSDVRNHPVYAALFGTQAEVASLALYTHHHTHRHDEACSGDPPHA